MSAATSIPRPEYPRPQFVRADWANLNGPWDFEIDQSLSGESRELQTGKPLSQKITVPFCPESDLSGIGEKDFMASVWYRRDVDIPNDWTANGKRVFLRFGACDYETTVWVNGQHIGFHRGGYTSFAFEITRFVKAGSNTIVIRAVDDTRSGLQPSGKQCDKFASYGCLYTRTTGIWQTVWLEAVPATYLHSVKYYGNIDEGSITIHAKVVGDPGGYRLRTTVRAGDKVVGQADVAASAQASFTIALSERHLWEPGAPYLYDVTFELVKDGHTVDTVNSYFGLRQISIDGKRVLINHKSVFQRLVLDQGFYPDGIYTAPSDEALRRDIELSLAMGFNGARLHEKVFEERFHYWADKLGYITWGEYPNWGLDHANPRGLERYTGEWLEAVDRDFDHPSIVGWCPFNETNPRQNPELLRMIYRMTKALDSTRPTIDTSGYVHVETDIYDCHNYEQNAEKFAATFAPSRNSDSIYQNFPFDDVPYAGQPYFCSEYGGIWWNPGQTDDNSWGYGDRPRTPDQFLQRYRDLTETLLFNPNMFAFCYTQLTNVEQEVNGLYTYERKPKFDPAILHKINTQKAAIES
ncbi:MAG TPA: glycoside hydrolase family 2 TIM barrel-domain containing protein [Anaerolineae bacterium]|jgi:beta-galactosidase/beta-glucuronidase